MATAHTLRLVALVALIGSAGAGFAQSPEKAVSQPPATSLRTTPTDAEKSGWRVTEPWWVEPSDKATTPAVRGRLYHQEYLSRVTPEPFRRSTLGAAPQVTADPGRAFNSLRNALRGRQERRMRESLEKELAAWIK